MSRHEIFDRGMTHHFRYHRKVMRLARAIAAIHVSDKTFRRFAPRELHGLKDNMQIRWKLEDRLCELLRKNGDFPTEGAMSMTKSQSTRELPKKSSEKVNLKARGWAEAVRDAEDRLTKNKLQAAKIRNALRIFKSNLQTGEPWPGTQSADRNSGEQHSV